MYQIRFFKWYVAGDPGGGSHIKVPFEIPDRTGTNSSAVQIRRAGYNGRLWLKAQLLCNFFFNWAQNVNRSLEFGKFFAGNTEYPQKPVVINHSGKVAIVGYPVKCD